MKVLAAAAIALSALGLHALVFAGELAGDLQKIAGKYQGQLETYHRKTIKQYDYTLEISGVDAQKKELSLKGTCDECETKVVSYSGCKIAEGSPEIKITCSGNDKEVEYILNGDRIKSTGYGKKGNAYTIVVKKQAQ